MFGDDALATEIATFLNAVFGEMPPWNFRFFVKLIHLTLDFVWLSGLALTLTAWNSYRLGAQSRRPE